MSNNRIRKTPNNQVDFIKEPLIFSVKAEYEDLISKYSEVLQYLTYNSEYFSLITRNKKPYSNRPPICIHDEMLEPLRPFLVHQEVNVIKLSKIEYFAAISTRCTRIGFWDSCVFFAYQGQVPEKAPVAGMY